MNHIAESNLSQNNTLPRGVNVVLLGATGAGKSTTGWQLAKLLGYGFIDLDAAIEYRSGKSVFDIFATDGEAKFRDLEGKALGELRGISSHVLAVGAGAAVEDENWQVMQELGLTVWLNTPSNEIARRLLQNPIELKKRPLLAEVLEQQDTSQRLNLLSERLKALIGHRISRYKQSDITISDAFSTPDTTARLIKDHLSKSHPTSFSPSFKPLDRWHIM